MSQRKEDSQWHSLTDTQISSVCIPTLIDDNRFCHKALEITRTGGAHWTLSSWHSDFPWERVTLEPGLDVISLFLNGYRIVIKPPQCGYSKLPESLVSISTSHLCALEDESISYPYVVFLLVLLPVVPCVAEHQAIACHPVRAPVSSLRGHCCNLHSVAQVHLEPLLGIGICWGPTTSSWNNIKERLVMMP